MKQYLDSTILLGVIIILLGIGLFALALGFPGDAGLFPKIFSALMVVLSAAMVINQFRRNVKEGEGERVLHLADVISVAPGYVILIGYVVLIGILGFFASTVIFLPVCMLYLGIRSKKALIGVTLGVNVFVYFLFVTQLNMTLPRGILF